MSETLTIIDNRTGKKYELPIADGAIRSTDLRQIKTDQEDVGLLRREPERAERAVRRPVDRAEGTDERVAERPAQARIPRGGRSILHAR